jgi:hypothetical protein
MTGRSRALVTPKIVEHLAKLLGMLGSDHDGEIANAGRAAHEFIRRFGLTWRDVLADPPADWQSMALQVRAHRHMLSPRESDFINNISRLRRQPTDKQLEWLISIYERVRRERSAA